MHIFNLLLLLLCTLLGACSTEQSNLKPVHIQGSWLIDSVAVHQEMSLEEKAEFDFFAENLKKEPIFYHFDSSGQYNIQISEQQIKGKWNLKGNRLELTREGADKSFFVVVGHDEVHLALEFPVNFRENTFILTQYMRRGQKPTTTLKNHSTMPCPIRQKYEGPSWGKDAWVFASFSEAKDCAKQREKPLLLMYSALADVNCRKIEAAVLNAPLRHQMQDSFSIACIYTDDRLADETAMSILKKHFPKASFPLFIILDANNEQVLGHHSLTMDDLAFKRFLVEGKE